MLIVLIRTVILYIVALFVIRIMGKGELAKLDPFQMVVLFMIAELATFPIESSDIPLFAGVVAMLALVFLQILISAISKKNQRFAELLSGRPSILISKGKINEKELKRLRLSIADLMQYLRLKNFPQTADVEYAILESNGDLSVIAKPEKRPLTPEDMDIVPDQTILPMTLIADGQLSSQGLRMSNIKEKTLQQAIRKAGAKSCQEVLYAYCDEHGKIHVHLRERKKG